MAHDGDAHDARLLAQGEHARLLAKWDLTIVQRCVARLHGHADAEDVAQDVKVRLWKELSGGKQYSVPFRVVVHQVIGWTLGDHFAGRPTHVPLPEGWDPADSHDDHAELVDRDAVATLLEPLEGKTKAVLELRYLARLEIDEIAAELQMTRNAVDQALHRGHKRLRETLSGG